MLRTVAATLMAVILVSACSTASSPTPSVVGGSPDASSGTSPAASTGFDPSAITGTAILSGWQSSPAEGNALTQALLSYQSAFPNVKVDYQPLGGDYAAGMAAKFASGDVPDVFYVDAGYAQQWIDQGYLAPLDDYIAKSNFDTTQFFDGLRLDLQGHRRQGLRPAQGRQHDRHGLQHRPRPDATQDHGRARHAWPSR